MSEKFSFWNVLFVQYLKRDWKKIAFWVLGLGLFCSVYVPAFEEIGKGQGLAGLYETLKNPAMISMVGSSPIQDSASYTLGSMYAQMMLLFSGLFAMIISALHVISHTRKEEELGLSELIRSFEVGRQANSLAVMIETVLINIVLGVFIGIVMSSFQVADINFTGSILFGLSIALAGIMGGVIALLMAQIMPSASGTIGTTLGIIGLLYIIRASSDVADPNLSLLNPMGWTYLTYPFSENRWYPLGIGIIFTLIILFISFLLEEKRDMGAGYLAQREGRATAKKSLLSLPGLFFHLNRGIIISWLIAFALLGAAYGSIYGDMQTFITGNQLISQMFLVSGVSMEASFTGTIMMVLMGLVAILPIVIINKLYSEETRMHLSQLYATKVTRTKLYWTTITLAIVAAILGILCGVIGLGGSAISVMSTSSMSLLDFMAVGFNFLPSILFFIALTSLALGFIPKLGKVVYVYLGYSFVLNYFAGILHLPDWFSKTAIMSWIPRMPVASFDPIIFISITIISIVLIYIGYIGYKNRDMQEGA